MVRGFDQDHLPLQCCQIERPAAGAGEDGQIHLRFDGLATLAEVWFNGELVLESSNMFCAHEVDVTDLVGDQNEVVIAFRSLEAALAEKRPRPRWKTKLVGNQQLRWFRTTLLGRIPGWTPAIRPVGPWRSVWLESISVVDVVALDLKARMAEGQGVVDVTATVRPVMEGSQLESARLRVGEEP